MPTSRILLALLAVILSLCLSPSAEARKRAWAYGSGFSAPFRDGESQNARAEGRRTRIDGRGAQSRGRGDRASESSVSTRATTGLARAEPDETISAKTGSGSFSATIDRLIRACTQQAVEFENWPLDDITRIAAPDDRQRGALEALRGAAVTTAACRITAPC
jgi:hypothetical protein